jgi:hypothetical protein
MHKKPSFWWENFDHRLGTIFTLYQFKHNFILAIIISFALFFRLLLFPYFFIRRLFVRPTMILNNLEKSIVKFQELPRTIQQVYESEYQIHKGTIYPHPKSIKYDLDNLDYEIVEAFYYKANGGSWAGSQYFVLNGQKFELFWQGNQQNPPYILFQLKFYYVVTLNPSGKDLNSIDFGVIDLSSYIQPKNNPYLKMI